MSFYLLGAAILAIMVFAIYRWGGSRQREKNVERRLKDMVDDQQALDDIKPSGKSDTVKRLRGLEGEF